MKTVGSVLVRVRRPRPGLGEVAGHAGAGSGSIGDVAVEEVGACACACDPALVGDFDGDAPRASRAFIRTVAWPRVLALSTRTSRICRVALSGTVREVTPCAAMQLTRQLSWASPPCQLRREPLSSSSMVAKRSSAGGRVVTRDRTSPCSTMAWRSSRLDGAWCAQREGGDTGRHRPAQYGRRRTNRAPHWSQHHHSWRCPRPAILGLSRQIALVGFDDFPLADLVEPAITVVRQDVQRIGTEVDRILLDRLADPPRHIVLEPSLVCRGSGENPTTNHA
jgi:hypothetical protein